MGAEFEIHDDDGELEILSRVAAIDVAKSCGVVCVRLPHPHKPGRRVGRTLSVEATTNAILQLADQLLADQVDQVEQVTLESTSDYSRCFYYLLESRGLHVVLVKPGTSRTSRAGPRRTSSARCGWPS